MNPVAERWLRQIIAAQSTTVVYIGVFLPPMDRQRLLRRFEPIHPEIFAHHMTLWTIHDSGDPDLDTLPLGKMVDLKIVGYAEDAKGQAVLVSPPTRLWPRNGRVPHITLSTATGVPPVYSNTLVESGEVEHGSFLKVQGRVGWWDGSQARFDMPAMPKTASSFRPAPGGNLLGYKVMRWDPVQQEAVSMANSRIRLPLHKGAVHRMPGKGIFLGADKQYVLDYYGTNDYNALVTYSFDPKDLLYGNLTDREPEIGVAAARVVDFALYDEDLNPL